MSRTLRGTEAFDPYAISTPDNELIAENAYGRDVRVDPIGEGRLSAIGRDVANVMFGGNYTTRRGKSINVTPERCQKKIAKLTKRLSRAQQRGGKRASKRIGKLQKRLAKVRQICSQVTGTQFGAIERIEDELNMIEYGLLEIEHDQLPQL